MSQPYLLSSILLLIVSTTYVQPEVFQAALLRTTATPVPAVRTFTAYTAFLRAEPVREAGTDIAVIPAETEVLVVGVARDHGSNLEGYWYQVQVVLPNQQPVGGWMHSTVLYLPAEQIAALIIRADVLTMPPSVAKTTPSPILESSRLDATSVPLDIPLTMRVCYDLHHNKVCDVDEGISGVMVYATDTATGQVLMNEVTDESGRAHFVWQLPPDEPQASLTLTVPYFQEVREVRRSNRVIKSVLIPTLAPIPTWIP